MIDIDHVRIAGFEPAIRGMRNSYSNWSQSDTEPQNESLVVEPFEGFYIDIMDPVDIGYKDEELMIKLIKKGEPHCKFRRMISVWMDIIAPRYWWIEYDTYKLGTVANSESTMHTLHKDPFDAEQFDFGPGMPDHIIKSTIDNLNYLWMDYQEAVKKGNKVLIDNRFTNMKALLPEGKRQMRTVSLNYSVLANMYEQRRCHRLGEWKSFCDIIEYLPYSWMITGKINVNGKLTPIPIEEYLKMKENNNA